MGVNLRRNLNNLRLLFIELRRQEMNLVLQFLNCKLHSFYLKSVVALSNELMLQKQVLLLNLLLCVLLKLLH
jgi:hypothetical protein